MTKARSDLARAEADLTAATLVAPFAGTVMEVPAGVGDSVSGAFVALADPSLPTLDTYFDESDLDKVFPGNEVGVVFDALPDLAFTGHLRSAGPSLLHAVAVLDGGPRRT